MKSVGNSPEHSRKTRRACQKRVFQAAFVQFASPAASSDVWKREVLGECSQSSALHSRGGLRGSCHPFFGHRGRMGREL